MRRVSSAGRWIVLLGLLTAIGVAGASAGSPARRPSAAATARVVAGLRVPGYLARPAKKTPKLGGVVFGGLVRTQDFPAVIVVNKKLTKVHGFAGVGLTCTPSGAGLAVPGSFPTLSLKKSGKFSGDSGDLPIDSGDPHVTIVFHETVGGTINKRHTKATGTWHLTITTTDTTSGQPVTDTCDSGDLAWDAVN
jgi:hypothetical protein